MEPEDIGLGIIRYTGSDLDTIDSLNVAGQRFLDVLWLPAPLAELSREQISVINRFREVTIANDAQFANAKRARQAYIAALKAISASSVLEIGCGKFPISIDIALSNYVGIDIDSEAIEWCNSNGINTKTLDEFRTNNTAETRFDAIIACYVFHFAISDELIDEIKRVSESGAIMIFNIIADEVRPVLSIITRMLNVYTQIEIVKSSSMPRREYWVVMSNMDTIQAAKLARDQVIRYYDYRP